MHIAVPLDASPINMFSNSNSSYNDQKSQCIVRTTLEQLEGFLRVEHVITVNPSVNSEKCLLKPKSGHLAPPKSGLQTLLLSTTQST